MNQTPMNQRILDFADELEADGGLGTARALRRLVASRQTLGDRLKQDKLERPQERNGELLEPACICRGMPGTDTRCPTAPRCKLPQRTQDEIKALDADEANAAAELLEQPQETSEADNIAEGTCICSWQGRHHRCPQHGDFRYEQTAYGAQGVLDVGPRKL